MLSFSRTFPWRILKSQIRKYTYRPLNAEQSEQERDAVVPPTGLVDEARRTKHVRRGMHLCAGRRREEHNDNDYAKIEPHKMYNDSKMGRTEGGAEIDEDEARGEAREPTGREAVLQRS